MQTFKKSCITCLLKKDWLRKMFFMKNLKNGDQVMYLDSKKMYRLMQFKLKINRKIKTKLTKIWKIKK